MIRVLKSFLKIGLGLFSVVFFLVLFFPAQAKAEVGAPRIIQLFSEDFLLVSGTAPLASDILLYLDGNFIGQTTSASNCSILVASGTSCQSNWNFKYALPLNLATGGHRLMAVTQDRTSLVLSAPSQEIEFTINLPPAPTLIAPDQSTATANLKPLIIGLTKNNTLVKIFIDDSFNGATGILKHDSGTANFAYRPALNLERGFHKIWAIAEDRSGRVSSKSELLNFKIELPLPAPTMLKPVVNRQTSLSRPLIVGLAKNNYLIKIYIDKKYDGELTVKNQPSGTANFAYQPKRALVRGEHSLYTVAVDQRGKESSWSNIVNFSIKRAVIAESAEEVGSSALIPLVMPGGDGQTAASQEKKAVLEKIENLLSGQQATSVSEVGLINESRQNQGRLNFGIIVFILFLLGVVAWLLWVNRELVKEKQRDDSHQKKDKNDQNNLLTPTG